MSRLSAQPKVWFTLICIVVVAMRLGGAHLHLCFDGSEPPATLHLDNHVGAHHDDAAHHLSGTETIEHADLDVPVSVDGLIKKVSFDTDLLALITILTLILYALPRDVRLLRFTRLVLPVTAHRAHLRPLLRGPPL